LHTNDAGSAVTRLVEMGVQPFLISSSLLAVFAQRLVRKLCLKCRLPFIPSDQDLGSLDLDPAGYGPPRPLIAGQVPPDSVPPAKADAAAAEASAALDDETTIVARLPNPEDKPPRPVLYKPVGCEACAETGYSGQIGIFELLVVDEAIRREVIANSDGKKIARVACSRGMMSLRDDGVRQVLAGRVSIEEVLAATHDADIELE
jgi:general secretion pathway protein E